VTVPDCAPFRHKTGVKAGSRPSHTTDSDVSRARAAQTQFADDGIVSQFKAAERLSDRRGTCDSTALSQDENELIRLVEAIATWTLGLLGHCESFLP